MRQRTEVLIAVATVAVALIAAGIILIVAVIKRDNAIARSSHTLNKPPPVHGGWASWSSWTPCTVTCANGTQGRSRTCTNPFPSDDGIMCVGSFRQQRTCTLQPCPVDGNWGTWESWGTCDRTCNSGNKNRVRPCNSPPPQHGGANCTFPANNERTVCNTEPCPEFSWARLPQSKKWVKKIGELLSFEAAQRECQELTQGGNLLSVHSEAQFEFIREKLEAEGVDIWIGLNDRDTEGQFKWADGTETGFTKFHPNEPDGATNENCVGHSSNSSRAWHTIPCSRKLPSLCQMDHPCETAACSDVLLILGGQTNGGMQAHSVDILSIRDEPVTCDSVPDFPPVENSEWPTRFMIEGDPVFCEGSNSLKCYRYSKDTWNWTEIGQMPDERQGSANIEMDGYTLITGGLINKEPIRSTVYWDEASGDFLPGPDLPLAVGYHCMVEIDHNRILLTGGIDEDDDNHYHSTYTYIFYKNTMTWSDRKLNTLNGRAFHSCGRVGHGHNRVMTAGGSSKGDAKQDAWTYQVFTRINHLGQMEDRLEYGRESKLPWHLQKAATVQLDDTILMIGGLAGALETPEVYEYDAESNKWLIWNQTMKVARADGHAVFRLPASYLDCAKLP